MLLEEGLRVRIVELPEGHDPDTYLKAEGAEAYRKRLDEAPEAVEWLMRRAQTASDPSSPAGKAAFFAAVLPALVRTANAVERQAWLARVVERGGLDAGGAREELRRALQGRTGRDVGGGGGGHAPPGGAQGGGPAAGRAVAARARGAGGGGRRDRARRARRRRTSRACARRALLRVAQAVARRNERVTLPAVLAGLDEDARRLMSEIAVEGVPTEGLSAEDCVRELRRQPLKARMAEIQKRLAGASGDAQEALLAEKTRLVRQMAGL